TLERHDRGRNSSGFQQLRQRPPGVPPGREVPEACVGDTASRSRNFLLFSLLRIRTSSMWGKRSIRIILIVLLIDLLRVPHAGFAAKSIFEEDGEKPTTTPNQRAAGASVLTDGDAA